MWRTSARTVVIVPWLLLTIALFAARTLSWLPAAVLALASLVLAFIVADRFATSLRSIRNDLRAGRSDFEHRLRIKELHEIAAAAANVNRELSGRATIVTTTEQQLSAVLDS